MSKLPLAGGVAGSDTSPQPAVDWLAEPNTLTAEQRAASIQMLRDWFTDDPLDENDVLGLVLPILDVFGKLHWATTERARAHVDIIERHGFHGPAPEDLAAARRHLEFHHRVADLVTNDFAGWVRSGRPSPAPVVRQALYMMFGTDELVHAIEEAEHNARYKTYSDEREAAAKAAGINTEPPVAKAVMS